MGDGYALQHRGSASAYAAYFAGMDASMQQKVALTTAFFPTRGRVADMGSGSGRGTFDLARLYPGLDLVGVDINPVSIARASEQYQLPNLRYRVGDIAEPVFAPSSLDGVLDSSVLHHVTSFNGFSLTRLETCLRNQVAALRPGGVLIVRDFVIPDGPSEVLLDLPSDDGNDSSRIPTAVLFERFASTFRSSQHPLGGVPYERLPPPAAGRARFRLGSRDAAEFILRKDYRDDWETELLEEYTYYSREDFEHRFRALGLRVLASVPLFNPWIVRHRYEGQVALFGLDGSPLPFPPTNYLVVGERITADQPIAIEEVSAVEIERPRFLATRSYRDPRSGEVLALVERPGRTLDLIPWFVRGGRACVVAKKGFPRPLLLNGAARGHVSGFITEPIAAIVEPDEPVESAAIRVLGERAGLRAGSIRAISSGVRYFTSPGALDECVEALLVEVTPESDGAPAIRYGDLGDCGSVRELDAAQLLRAAQVGGTFDARLEIGAYRALAHCGQALDPWIGAAVELAACTLDDGPRGAEPAEADSPVFVPVAAGSRYLRVMEGTFVARGADGTEIARASREYVVPREATHHTISVLPALRAADGVYVALEASHLPAVQRFTGRSRLDVCPAFRLPRAIVESSATDPYLRERLSALGIRVGALTPLGAPYLPSVGATPEIVAPFAAEVLEVRGPQLRFVRLSDLLSTVDEVLDGHLKISVLRLSHALGGV